MKTFKAYNRNSLLGRGLTARVHCKFGPPVFGIKFAQKLQIQCLALLSAYIRNEKIFHRLF